MIKPEFISGFLTHDSLITPWLNSIQKLDLEGVENRAIYLGFSNWGEEDKDLQSEVAETGRGKWRAIILHCLVAN